MRDTAVLIQIQHIMKRIVVALALIVAFEFCSMARIETQKSGKYLAVKFYAPNLESVTEELFIKDYWDAIEFAKAKKCHTISFYGNDGFTFCFIKGYEEIEKADRYLAELLEKIPSMATTEFIQGEKIGTERVSVAGAKYRQETYLNGKLHDVYESDWDSGPFAPRTSTYISGGDTYVTKTFYVAPKHADKAKYGEGSYVTTPGITVFAKKTYHFD